eukprot:scaffold1881_cov256-Pinguiococcus_pyrenoidosus.AAC.1
MSTPAIDYDAVSDQLRQQKRGGRQEGGRVRCPLCDPRRAKRFGRGRGLRMHLLQKHASQVQSAPALAALMDRAEAEAPTEELARPGKRKRKREDAQAAGRAEDELLAAAKAGDKDAFLETMEPLGVEVALGARDRHGASVLDWAAGGGHLDLLATLLGLQKELSPEDVRPRKRRRRRDGRSALHWAARNGQVDAIQLLLRHIRGPDATEPVLFESVDEEAYDGTTPLM